MDFLHTLQPTYCERTGSGLLAEPLNLFSNLGFFVAAYAAQQAVMRQKGAPGRPLHRGYLQFLVALVALVGCGSAAFHAVPGSATLLADSIPIDVFILSSVLLCLRLLTGRWGIAAFIVVGIIGVLVAVTVYVPRTFLNGSVRHAVMLLFGIGLWYACFRKYGSVAWGLVLVLFSYACAIAMRSLDKMLCAMLPMGTHFLWHLFAATAAYFLVAFLVRLDTNVSFNIKNQSYERP